MSKTNFVSGTVVSPAFLNAVNNIIFDGQDLDGHLPKIKNTDLDATAGQLLPEWQTFRDLFLVTVGTGLSINYNGGFVTLEDGSVMTLAPGSISVPASSVSYIYVDTTGAIATSTVYPARSLMLAKVTTLASSISSIVDLRPRFAVRPRSNVVSIFGGIGAQGDYTLNSGTDTLTGSYSYRNFTIAAGATVNSNGYLFLKCSGNVVINGNINITALVAGGGRFGSGISVQDYVSQAGQGLGGGTGHNSSATPIYDYTNSPNGSGGASGFARVSNAFMSGYTSQGGNGGGSIIIRCAGTITIGGTIIANGSAAISPIITTIASPTVAQLGGGGGGSGGLILLESTTSIQVSPSATLSVQGGAGGNGYTFGNSNETSGGGGGGGGYIVFFSPSNNSTGATLQLNGGAVGTKANAGLGGNIAGSNGGSFGGVGGIGAATSLAGSSGQLIVRNFSPA